MKLPPLKSLQVLETAVRHESFSKAADELCVTHAAVSHQIKQLETWLGKPMFERRGRGVVPTRPARELADILSNSFYQISEKCAAIKGVSKRPCLTLGIIPSFATRWLIPSMPYFQEAHPGIEIRIMYIHDRQNLDLTHNDIVICHGNRDIDTGVVHHLFSARTSPVCSPGYLEAHGPFTNEADLMRASLLHDETYEAWNEWFRNGGVEASLHQGVLFEDFNLLSTSAIAGHGVALCPVELVRHDFERNLLVQLFDRATHQELSYFLAHKENPRKEVAIFKNWLMEVIN